MVESLMGKLFLYRQFNRYEENILREGEYRPVKKSALFGSAHIKLPSSILKITNFMQIVRFCLVRTNGRNTFFWQKCVDDSYN